MSETRQGEFNDTFYDKVLKIKLRQQLVANVMAQRFVSHLELTYL